MAFLEGHLGGRYAADAAADDEDVHNAFFSPIR
jgi:hypothetical protein